MNQTQGISITKLEEMLTKAGLNSKRDNYKVGENLAMPTPFSRKKLSNEKRKNTIKILGRKNSLMINHILRFSFLSSSSKISFIALISPM